MTNKLICIGQFLGAHGVKGLAKLAAFTENPEDIGSYGALTDAAGKKTYDVALKSWNKSHFIAEVKGIADRDAAEKLKGVKLYVPRAKLPKAKRGQYYYADLVGLEARLADGSVFGTVTDVKNFGAGDILEIKLSGGGRELFPFNNNVVPDVFVSEGYLTINPPDYIDGEDDRD